jgi:DNA-binding transcriptional ArsR family regulator
MIVDRALRVLANPKRRQILDWLKDPVRHFPPQVDGDLVRDGVCVVFIAEKLGVAQPTATQYLTSLAQLGVVRPKRIKKWTFYKRDERAVRKIRRLLVKAL